jgi:hypothetical protein
VVAVGNATRSRAALVLAAVLCCGGCAVFGTDLTSIPTFSPEIPTVYTCARSGIQYAPASGPRLCFSLRGVKMEIEANNAEAVAGAIGPLPLVPFFHPRRPSARPLMIGLAFQPDGPYSFQPWQVSLQTDQGETVRVADVKANVRVGRRVETVAIDHDARALEAHRWSHFFLTFEKHVGPEQRFSLTLRLIAPDGADVRVPIRFKEGKVSYLAAIP